MTTTAVPTGARSHHLAVTDRLRRGYERQDAVGMGDLYAHDATWELHVGESHVLLRGRPAIVERYAGDLHLPPVLRCWDVRRAPWGAVVEAEAEQVGEETRVRYRWVHLLTIEQGRITRDVIYCTGAVPATASG
jgi:ketosteroid isomerase-like protein